ELRTGWRANRHPLLKAARRHAWRVGHLRSAKTVATGRLNEHDYVVSYGRIATFHLRLGYPVIFLEAAIDFIDLITHHALGRNGERLVAHVEDFIGLGNAPSLGIVAVLGQLRPVPLGTTVLHPAIDGCDFFGGERGVVLEFLVLGRRQPRRHSALVDHF